MHHGTEMNGAASLRVQVEGARIIVVADLADVQRLLQKMGHVTWQHALGSIP